MKNLSLSISRVMFYVLAAALFVWTASLTLTFVGRALPGLETAKYFALAVFDIGALVWIAVFIHASSGLAQRSTALLLTVFDLVGVGLMVVAELLLGGQTYIVPPAELGSIAIWSIGLWTFINLGAIYVFHLVDPETMRQISIKTAQDKIVAKSLQELDRRTDQISDEVADQLAARLVNQTLTALSVNQLDIQKPVAVGAASLLEAVPVATNGSTPDISPNLPVPGSLE